MTAVSPAPTFLYSRLTPMQRVLPYVLLESV